MNEESLFHEALRRSTPHERAAFLNRTCSGQPRMRAAVESLLAAHEQEGAFLSSPAIAAAEWSDSGEGVKSEPFPEKETENRAGTADQNSQVSLTTTLDADRQTASVATPGNKALSASPPVRIGRYEIREELGRGGMGTVFLAYDPELDRVVALKVPKLGGPAAEERFLREARAAAAVSHPNLCPVHDAGRADGVLFLAMTYVPGSTLCQMLKETGPMAPQRASAIAIGVARGMAEAHRHGIVHRDLKPGNILLNPVGEPVVTDFGLAHRESFREIAIDREVTTDHDPRLTQAGAVMGTPAYMPPEQARGDLNKIGPASDVYALGAILFEMLTGNSPFRGDSIAETIKKIETDPVPAMAGVPARLEAICRRALAKNPDDRISSMDAFAQELAKFSLGNRRRRRNRIALATTACVLLLVAAVVLYIKTDNGTIEVRLNDPTANVEVTVNGNEVVLTEGGRMTKLRTGDHTLIVSGPEYDLESKTFKIKRGEKTIVEVELKPKQPALAKPLPKPQSIEDRAMLARVLARGRKMLEDSRFEEMGKAADEALKIDPDSPGGLALRATLRAFKGELEGAKTDADAALKLNPDIREALIARAIVLAEDGKFAEAIVAETIAIEIDPSQPRAWSNRSNSFLELKDYRQALADSTQAIKLELGGPDALLCRAGAYGFLGDDLKALADYEQAAKVAPNNWHVYDQRSALHAKMGNTAKEKTDWAMVKKLDPTAKIEDRVVFAVPPKPPTRKKITAEDKEKFSKELRDAQAAWETGRFPDCRSAIEEAFRIDPTSGQCRAWRARLLAQDGKYEVAAKEATEAIRLDYSVTMAHIVRGVAQIEHNDTTGGIVNLVVALTLDPKDPVAWYNRGLAFMNRGEFHQALRDFTQAIRFKPNLADAFVNRGVCYLSIGEYKAALAEYTQAIGFQSSNGRWILIRSAIRAKLGDGEGSRKDRELAIELDPSLAKGPAIDLPVPLPPIKQDPN